jgi:hypothetical protein
MTVRDLPGSYPSLSITLSVRDTPGSLRISLSHA